jgi:mono/diheme cytochrome c family protein
MVQLLRRVVLLGCCAVGGVCAAPSPADALSPQQLARGKLFYLQHCVICHQANGQGAAGAFPPLANSDYLMASKERTIRILVEGLSGPTTVNSRKFDGVMPPVVLNDRQVADVLTFVRNNFGNSGEPITIEEVKQERAKSRFPTYEALVKASAYPMLPQARGFAVREVARLPAHGTRLASYAGSLFVLGGAGDVWRVEPRTGQISQWLVGARYCEDQSSTMGLAFDRSGRLYVTGNRKLDTKPFATNEVTVYRSTGTSREEQLILKPWLRTLYPWGIGPFNHGVSHIAIGPDGFIYVSSGSRTDGNEAGSDVGHFTGGEVTETACIWRLDAAAEQPKIEIFARGLRNAYGFCWTDRGAMYATDNGPDADMPEELNRIERGNHYGFPFQFSNRKEKPYSYTPEPPSGITFILPIANEGPAAGGAKREPLYTFDPHSSPAGIVFLGKEFPAEHRGTLLVVRFGNLLKRPRDVGFDVLQVRLKTEGTAEIATLLSPLGRPLDIHLIGTAIYVLEYSRETNNNAETGSLPGRVIELLPSPRPPDAADHVGSSSDGSPR